MKSLARTKRTNLQAKAGEKMNMKLVTRGLRHLDLRKGNHCGGLSHVQNVD